MRQRHLIAACAVLAVSALPAVALEPQQFAVGWPLEVPEEPGFFDIPLSLEMYQHARRLEEFAVLDLGGEPMSFYRVNAPARARAERRTELAASAVYEREPGGGATQVDVDDTGRRTSVTVTRSDEAADSAISAFIVDARTVATAPSAIELSWRPLAQPFLMEVRIEQSQNLSDWRHVGRASIASLSIDGTPLVHGRVPVNAAAGGYYRITWSRTVADWHLERAVLVSAALAEGPRPSLARFAPIERAANSADEQAEGRILYFDLGGRLPVTAVTLDFTAANRWARGRLESSNSAAGPWQARAPSRLFYELDYEGEELVSSAVEIGRVEDRYWRAVLDDVPLPGAVELRVAYPQEHLRFVAGGIAPYMLVAGTVAPAAGPDPTLEAVWRDLRPGRATPRAAAVGERVMLGGAAALEPPFAFPWGTALLWAVLGIGVMAVAIMAVRLAREMK